MTEVSMSFVTRPVESAATFLCLEVQLGLRVAENEPDSVSVSFHHEEACHSGSCKDDTEQWIEE